MKRSILLAIVITCTSFFTLQSKAQEAIAEGVVAYNVVMESESGTAHARTQSGTYRIIFRNKWIRKDLVLENGFSHTIIWDDTKKTGYSLQLIAGKKYAVQLSMDDIDAVTKPYIDFLISDSSDREEWIAGYKCRAVTVSYKNGQTAELCCTDEVQLAETRLYDWLPGMTSLPLSFDFKTEAAIRMRLQLDYLLNAPVSRSEFRVPREYRMITNEEYKRLIQ